LANLLAAFGHKMNDCRADLCAATTAGTMLVAGACILSAVPSFGRGCANAIPPRSNASTFIHTAEIVA
jgi:hypothetical protein